MQLDDSAVSNQVLNIVVNVRIYSSVDNVYCIRHILKKNLNLINLERGGGDKQTIHILLHKIKNRGATRSQSRSSNFTKFDLLLEGGVKASKN